MWFTSNGFYIYSLCRDLFINSLAFFNFIVLNHQHFLQVTPPQLRMQQDFFELLENSSAFFEDFIFEEGTQKAWQLMTAMLLTLEKQEFETRNFSGSATPSQLKSAVSVKNLGLIRCLCSPIFTFRLLFCFLFFEVERHCPKEIPAYRGWFIKCGVFVRFCSLRWKESDWDIPSL